MSLLLGRRHASRCLYDTWVGDEVNRLVAVQYR